MKGLSQFYSMKESAGGSSFGGDTANRLNVESDRRKK